MWIEETDSSFSLVRFKHKRVLKKRGKINEDKKLSEEIWYFTDRLTDKKGSSIRSISAREVADQHQGWQYNIQKCSTVR